MVRPPFRVRRLLEVLDCDGAERLRVLPRLDEVQLVALRQDFVAVLLGLGGRLQGRSRRTPAEKATSIMMSFLFT